jgi:uncharacterized peroxidase-related enzyme
MKKEKLWSLNIPIKTNPKDLEIQNFFKICIKKLGLIPNIIKTNSIDKKKFYSFNVFYKRLMQDDNYLSKIEKEMIAVVVSSTNRCLYCCVSHGYTLGVLLKNVSAAKDILINYKVASISKKHKLMLDFVSKLTLESHKIIDEDRNKLRKAKFSEYQILEIIEVTAFFNMTNRIASGTNMIPNKEYYS